MTMAITDSHPSFLIAALLAGRLYRVLTIAKTMSISSSNAKAISIRGGTKTAGFKPITEFISDMARDTISISAKINTTALHFSITAVDENRTMAALNDFNHVIEQMGDHTKKDVLYSLINSLQKKINHSKNEQANYCRVLAELFDDITQRIRAAKVIVTNSRTEASRAGEYQTNLFSIADDLELCSENIADEIKICRNYLENLTNTIGSK
jgi:hypothetical protein